MRTPSLLVALALSPIAAPLTAQGDDRAAVERAALDYLEGFYEGDTIKLFRSVSPQVLKFGFYRGDNGSFSRSDMGWPNFASFAAGVRAGRNLPPEGAPKQVTLFDVQSHVASARVDAWWGMDYLLLAKIEGRWMITQVLWQGPPTAVRPPG